MAGIWYRQGTVALTQGSDRVTGTGTLWLDQAVGPTVGNTFWGPDDKPYEVERVISNTELDLVEAYAGATVSGAAYKIVTPEKFSVAALASQVAATLQYAQAQYANMSTWAASDLPVDVPVILPDGVSSKNIPNLAKMSKATATKLTETSQLKALDVPSKPFGRARLADENAAAQRSALGLGSASIVDVLGVLSPPGETGAGAIIESRSNANGRYVKYADGTLICSVTKVFVPTASLAPGSFAVLRISGSSIWAWPALFTGVPVMSFAMTTGNSWALKISSEYVAADGYGNFHVTNLGVAAWIATPTVFISAIGRWY